MGLNDNAWEKLFEEYKILDKIQTDGQYVISTRQIKKYREPRLMTKFDHKINLPDLFQKHQLSILPISRTEYVISSFDAYKGFDEPTCDIMRVRIPSHLQSLMPQFITSEAIALNCASACGIFSHFLNEEVLIPTVSGRMGSGRFDFNINTKIGLQNVSVANSQIEIDAAYEGIGSLAIVEAKQELSKDFLIRQLYYPFRVWQSRITKPIKPIFLIYANGEFHLYEYCFSDIKSYNSLNLVKQQSYLIHTEITLQDIDYILKNEQIVPEPEIPFPQADSFERIINLIEMLNEGSMNPAEITAKYLFQPRQTDYYTNAARYLGLVKRSKTQGVVHFSITPLGKQILNLHYKEKQLAFARCILQHQVFNQVMKLCLQCGVMPDHATIVNIMKQANLYRIESNSTYERRASTVISWLNWVLKLIDD